MPLTVRDVSRLLDTSEKTLYRSIRPGTPQEILGQLRRIETRLAPRATP